MVDQKQPRKDIYSNILWGSFKVNNLDKYTERKLNKDMGNTNWESWLRNE